MQRILAGDSAAEELSKKNMDRIAAEQASIAAGARGQSVAAARRNQAANTGLLQQEAAGQAREARAKEIADAARGLLDVGTAVGAQDIQKARLNPEVELDNARRRDTAVQAAKDRFARGEITQAELDTQIAKANADYVQGSQLANQGKDVSLETTKYQGELQTAIHNDDRLQAVFTRQAELQLAADQGNQQAINDLSKLQATLDTEINPTQARNLRDSPSILLHT